MNRLVRTKTFVSVLLFATLALFSIANADEFFTAKIEPLLKEHCFSCHSHAAGKMKGGLSLDSKSGWVEGGDSGTAIVPGKPNESLLIAAIRRESFEMPPDKKLPDEAIADLVKWVEMGAPDPRTIPVKSRDNDWWSLRPLVRPDLPPTNNDPSAPSHPIDRFVDDRLSQNGLRRSPEADRRALIRRLYFDLHGLPPAPDEVDRFVNNNSPNAYEQLVEQLLESPRYGERWARHWFDTIHFADSHGYEHDVGREHAWRYRDYVIDALNSDKPYARFIREQLAVDVLFPTEVRLTPALGFLGAGTFDFSTYATAPVTFDYLDRDDLVTQTTAAFLSTTANCARCHAHKFDPISQEDYYSLQAVFSGVLKGDVWYDERSEIAQERRRWKSVEAAASQKDASVLLAAEYSKRIQDWCDQHSASAKWQPIAIETFLSSDGSKLSRANDHVILAGGTRPETDTYTVTASPVIDRITAIRLEVLADDTLPKRGPGRQDNGNLHLSEVEVRAFEAGGSEGKLLPIRRATADFNQSGWGIERAIDSDPKTAWGIFPSVGQSHHAVFELAEPLASKSGVHLTIALKQLHGQGHLIGAFRLAITSADGAQATAIPIEVEQALAVAPDRRSESERLAIASFAMAAIAKTELAKLPSPAQVYAAAARVDEMTGDAARPPRALAEPKVVHVLHRGEFNKPRDVVGPGALATLPHLPGRFTAIDQKNEGARRAALADWIAHPENPLTWRSIVNRVWHFHFGRGLCDTPSDFGRMGGTPSHPELLDWLAVWFRDDAEGSLRKLHRLIVTSETYRQASTNRADAAQIDGENQLLWRQNRQRVDADCYRDFTLVVSGNIDYTMGGPGVKYFKTSKGQQLTPMLDYTGFDWSKPGVGRRSVYRFVWRGIPDPLLESLDFPDLGLLTPVRGFSASALQALTLFNNDFVLYHSELLAKRVAAPNDELETQVQKAVRLVWQRAPTPDELSALIEYARRRGMPNMCRLLLNSNEFLFVD